LSQPELLDTVTLQLFYSI